MQKKTFEDEINSLRSSVKIKARNEKLLVISNVILAGVIAVTFNHERIVTVPAMAPQYKMMISNDKASPEYLDNYSRNILDLLLNITPNNVQAQQNMLIGMVDPKYRDELQSKLIDIANQVKSNNLSQTFYIQQVRIINKPNVVFVTGMLNQFIDKNIANSKRVNYKLSFNVSNYNARLTGIEQLADNDPQMKELR